MTPALAWLLLALCWGGLVAVIAHDVRRAPRSRCPSCNRDLHDEGRVLLWPLWLAFPFLRRFYRES